MADKSFEEQVREELSGLQLTPDKQVWENIHIELHAEKKRRWLVWLMALLIIGGASAVYVYQAGNGPSLNIQNGVTTRSVSDAGPKTNTTMQKPISEIRIKADTKTKKPRLISENKSHIGKSLPAKNAEFVQSQPAKLTRSETDGYNRQRVNAYKEISSPLANSVSTNSQIPTIVLKSDKIIPDVGNEAKALGTTLQEKQATSARQTTEDRDKSVSETKSTLPEVATESKKTSPATDSMQSQQSLSAATVIPVARNDRKKWKFFGTAELGMSAEIHSLRSAGLVFDASRQNNIGGGAFFAPGNAVLPGNSFSSAVLYKTPSRSDGMSWSIGAQAIQSINKKWDWGISLGYNYYSSSIGIGARGTVNAMSNATTDTRYKSLSDNGVYYLSTDSVQYTNKHHFLMSQIELIRNFRIGNSTSLRWGVGTGLGVLLSTNVLHFDESNGILYSNRALLSNLQMNISTSLDLGIGKKQAFFIGPRFSYFPGTSSKEGTNTRHLFNAGLRATIAIPGRKK